MEIQEQIIKKIADQECKKISRKVIKSMLAIDFKSMPGAKQSGDGSPLANTWDEICVQIQSEKSFFWDAYVMTMTPYLTSFIEHLPEHIKQAIWLQTDQGFDYLYGDPDYHEEEMPCSIEDISDYILNNYILVEADKWSNKRIREYLYDFY